MNASVRITKIVLATRNEHKAAELQALLALPGVEILDLRSYPDCPEVVEDGATLEDNALKKALAVHQHTKLPALADDTGLEVFYLLGAPGVYSARYAGENATYADNCRKLLQEMTQVPPRKRGARFRCVLALVAPGLEEFFEGEARGSITIEPRGENGFGYDPVFQPEGYDRTFAELSPEEKNALSHRGLAATKCVEYIASLNK